MVGVYGRGRRGGWREGRDEWDRSSCRSRGPTSMLSLVPFRRGGKPRRSRLEIALCAGRGRLARSRARLDRACVRWRARDDGSSARRSQKNLCAHFLWKSLTCVPRARATVRSQKLTAAGNMLCGCNHTTIVWGVAAWGEGAATTLGKSWDPSSKTTFLLVVPANGARAAPGTSSLRATDLSLQPSPSRRGNGAYAAVIAISAFLLNSTFLPPSTTLASAWTCRAHPPRHHRLPHRGLCDRPRLRPLPPTPPPPMPPS
jgi:hypothetical protein